MQFFIALPQKGFFLLPLGIQKLQVLLKQQKYYLYSIYNDILNYLSILAPKICNKFIIIDAIRIYGHKRYVLNIVELGLP